MLRLVIVEDEMDEWKTITRADKKRVMRRGRTGKKGGNVQEHPRIEVVVRLQRIIESTRRDLRGSRFWRQMEDSLEKLCQKPREIVCYGVGSFSTTSDTHVSAALWQLVFALELSEHMGVTNTSFFDPCTTVFENGFLTEVLGLEVLESNDSGKHCVNEVPTLFFMPHCPRSLYEHVVWANWESSAISIVGNSLKNQCESLTPTHCACIRAALPRLHEIELQSTKIDIKELPGNFEGAFNDTYLTWFDEGPWPVRPTLEDAEDPELS